MRWLLAALLFPIVCVVAFFDTVIWNATHGFGNKTTVQQSFREIYGMFWR